MSYNRNNYVEQDQGWAENNDELWSVLLWKFVFIILIFFRSINLYVLAIVFGESGRHASRFNGWKISVLVEIIFGLEKSVEKTSKNYIYSRAWLWFLHKRSSSLSVYTIHSISSFTVYRVMNLSFIFIVVSRWLWFFSILFSWNILAHISLEIVT